MCRMKSEGTSYTKCGHYIQTKWVAKLDCGRRNCAKSDVHPPNCATCGMCQQHFYPDEEKITAYSDNWCHLCEPWYGPSSRRRR